jgi:hypothetical protein
VSCCRPDPPRYGRQVPNSQEQTPGDIGRIDAKHAEISTVRASFDRVHFDGRNRARGDDEPGGPLIQPPTSAMGFGLEGGFILPGFFKPVNAAIRFEDSRFSDLPGQAGIFAPELVEPDDPACTFGPDAVQARVIVKDSVSHATPEACLSQTSAMSRWPSPAAGSGRSTSA